MTGMLTPSPMGGGILATGGGGAGYGGLLNALIGKYGRAAMDPQTQPPAPVDETAMAELLGLIPRQQQPLPSMQYGGPR